MGGRSCDSRYSHHKVGEKSLIHFQAWSYVISLFAEHVRTDPCSAFYVTVGIQIFKYDYEADPAHIQPAKHSRGSDKRWVSLISVKLVSLKSTFCFASTEPGEVIKVCRPVICTVCKHGDSFPSYASRLGAVAGLPDSHISVEFLY